MSSQEARLSDTWPSPDDTTDGDDTGGRDVLAPEPADRRASLGASPYYDAAAAADNRDNYEHVQLAEPANCCQRCGHVLGERYRRLNGRDQYGQHEHVVFACVHCVDHVEMLRGAGRVPDYEKGSFNQADGRT